MTTIQRLKIVRLITEQATYRNDLERYLHFGPFDGNEVANVLHTALKILPEKVLSVTYSSNNDPFENFTNRQSSYYAFIDFHWIEEDTNAQRNLQDHNALCIQRSAAEVWLLKPQDLETNLLQHSANSSIIYFSDVQLDDVENCDTVLNIAPFDGNQPGPIMFYRDAYISIQPNTFSTKS